MTKEFARFLKNDAGQKKCYGSKTFTRMHGRLFFSGFNFRQVIMRCRKHTYTSSRVRLYIRRRAILESE